MDVLNGGKRTNKVRNISLPTLLEYGDLNMEDWSTDKNLWMRLADVNKVERKGCDLKRDREKSSSLPSLTSKVRKLNLMTLEEEVKFGEPANDERNQGSDEGQGSLESYDENEETSSDDECDEVFCEEFDDDNRSTDFESGQENEDLRDNGGMKSSAVQTKEDRDKMRTVNEWVKTQAIVNKVPIMKDAEDIRVDKVLPEIALTKNRNLLRRNRANVVETRNTRRPEHANGNELSDRYAPKMNEGSVVRKGRKEAGKFETGKTQRSAECDEKRRNVVDNTITSLHTCYTPKINENKAKAPFQRKLERSNISLVRTFSNPLRTDSPFPTEESLVPLSGSSYTARTHSNTVRHIPMPPNRPIQSPMIKTRNSSDSLESTVRGASAFSWPASSNGISRHQSEHSLRRRVPTPRPPNMLARCRSMEL